MSERPSVEGTTAWLTIQRRLDPTTEDWFNAPKHEYYALTEIRRAFADLDRLKAQYPESSFRLIHMVQAVLMTR